VVLIGAKDKRCPRCCRGMQTQVRQTLSMAGVFGGKVIMLIRRETTCRDRRLMAGSATSRTSPTADLGPTNWCFEGQLPGLRVEGPKANDGATSVRTTSYEW